MDKTVQAVTPSDEYFSHLLGNTGPIEDHFEGHTKRDIECSSSAEPHIWNLLDERASPSPTACSDDGFFVCASMKKLPSLTEADITDVSKEDGEQVDEQVTIAQCNSKEKSLLELDSVQTSVHKQSLLVKQTTEAEQDEFKTVLPSLQLDKW